LTRADVFVIADTEGVAGFANVYAEVLNVSGEDDGEYFPDAVKP
jgi:hypothetical protein